ncbi:type IX secretion system membrane protein PorP/SprF [Prolixibacteraceae bacterium Z1-6]|uniref:Type IX secretion system membrane protein PorP/SprF n=1 Tax=Draconibacterium aestuarii TaxID=2998507 RepID=A0A9X3F5C6_9BACT|nr:type IX secretion system membrane protein PorP/SprF [Prolixibacteraceae bacterium Z1-6]
MSRVKEIAVLGFMLLAIWVATNTAYAQQDPMYTQYMDNLLIINPGFAGSRIVGNALLVARSQWVEFEGAPTTRSFAYNTSLQNKKIGFGFSVMSDKIGPLKQTGVYVDYSYFLQVSNQFKVGMGLKGGVSFYRANLTDLETISPDPIFNNDIYENFLPNVGVGFFLFSDDTYFGLSVPKLIENKITRETVTTEYVNKQQIHIYFIGGHSFELSEDYRLKTSTMVRWVKSAPVSFDVNALAGFKEKFWLGGFYRFNAAFGIIAQFKPTSKMTIGYSYDITISELSGFNNGSHEIMFSYDWDLFSRKAK